MPRASPLRKALLALAVLTLFMFILRLSRPAPAIGDIDVNFSQAAKLEAEEASKASSEAAGAAAKAQKDARNDLEAAEDLAKAASDKLDSSSESSSDTRAAKNGAKNPQKPVSLVGSASAISSATNSKLVLASSAFKSANAASAPSSLPSQSHKPRTPTNKNRHKESSSDFDARATFEEIVFGANSPPVVIFSKSYCPYSMRAKNLLLEAYLIRPAPLVVELDKMDHGSEMQDYLNEVSGRRTVPNIFVNGESRGGATEMADLGDSLASQFNAWGGNKLAITAQQARVADDSSRH